MAKTVGVLGGLGPDATVDFMSRVIELTPADKDQDHIPMIVDHNPSVPNRQAAILKDGESPGPLLAEMARRLQDAGADFLVIVCNSAHAFTADLEAATSIPLLSIIDVTADACEPYDAVAVLATDGCIASGVYQQALERRGINVVLPDADELAELMRLINAIKAGDQGEQVTSAMQAVARAQVAKGAKAIVAGCTEIPLVLRDGALDVPVVSSTDVLAAATVSAALGSFGD